MPHGRARFAFTVAHTKQFRRASQGQRCCTCITKLVWSCPKFPAFVHFVSLWLRASLLPVVSVIRNMWWSSTSSYTFQEHSVRTISNWFGHQWDCTINIGAPSVLSDPRIYSFEFARLRAIILCRHWIGTFVVLHILWDVIVCSWHLKVHTMRP